MSRRPIHQYPEIHLTNAMAAIRNGMKIREASRVFGVPRGTLQDRLHSRVPEVPRKMGPDTILSKEEETAIKDWCVALAKSGFPLKSDDLLNTVYNIISEDKRPNPFVNNRPGKKWFQSFLKRNPELSERTPENISKGRAAVTEEIIRKWFADLQKHLEDKGASDILTQPDRILNGDETSFYICPNTGKVIAPRGYKNVYKIVKGKEKEAITVLLFMSASGRCLPPCVVFPYVRPPKDVVNSMPAQWLLGKSETGWMKADIFYDYIVKGLDKWVEEQNIPKPVLVFVDGHKSHLTMRLSEYCDQNNIILHSLPPNATHLIQPADVSVFKSLKSEWKNTVHEWAIRPENINTVLTKSTFCPLLSKILEKENLPVSIRNGFRKCGLYPFNPDALDYTKCVQNNLNNFNKQTTHKISSPDKKIKKTHLNTAVKVISQLSKDLENGGVDPNVVINILNQVKETRGTESLNSSTNSTTEENKISSKNSNLDDNDQSIISLPIIGDRTLENNLFPLDESLMPLDEFEVVPNVEILFHDKGITENMCVNESNKKHLNSDTEYMTANKQNLNSQEAENTDTNKENYPVELNLEDNIEINKEGTGIFDLNVDDLSKWDTTNNIEEYTMNDHNGNEQNINLKPAILSEVIVRSDNVSPFLKKHLILPTVLRKTKTLKSINRIGAISSAEWREFEKNKQHEKEQKKREILIRKRKRLEAKEKKKAELQKRKAERTMRTMTNKKQKLTKKKKNTVNETDTKKKIKCGECDDEMISDTETNDLKNIGCDLCPAWYHLKCTEFSGNIYENVLNLKFVCHKCKYK